MFNDSALLVLLLSQTSLIGNIAVKSEGCLFVISSFSPYIWSGDGGIIYFQWCLNRILAWGELEFAVVSFCNSDKSSVL